MKMLKLGLIGLLLIVCSLLPLGCGGSDSDDLPVQTIEWKDDGNGYVQYYTNDKQKCSLYTDMYRYYLHCLNPENPETPMGTLIVEFIKKSGHAEAGFGVFFCSPNSSKYYKLDITVDGFYKVSKFIKDAEPELSTIKNWTNSDELLVTGYGKPNTIKIERNSTDNTFYIYFNDYIDPVYSFLDEDNFTGGYYGFSAGIHNAESFPNTPVDIRYRLIEPEVSESVYKSNLIDTIYQSNFDF